MGFDDAVANAMARWFGSDLAAQVTLNNTPITAILVQRGRDEDDNSMFDFVELEFQRADYATPDYRNDTVVYDGVTWRYPRDLKMDAYTRTVRFIDNQRPKHRR